MNDQWKSICLKILGAYALFLVFIGTIFNLVVCTVCFQNKLWTTNTFKFIVLLSICDIISLYEWNLNHFIVPFFNIDFTFKNLIWCRISLFLQYICLQYSAWILV